MAWYDEILYWMTHARMHAWDIHGKMPGFENGEA